MNTLTALSAPTRWLDDRINPIVVKELRQAVKSRFIVGVLLLMLAILVATLLLFVMNSRNLGLASSGEGRDLFLIFQATLLGLTMLCVPVYLGARLTAERSSATSDLLYVTTLRPSSIIWGKLVAGMAVTGLVFAVCVPFMVVTYLLRGIDPPTVLFILALDAMLVLSASTLAIFLGALPVGWPVKILLGLIATAAGFSAFAGITGSLVWELSRSGIGSAMATSDFWWGVLGVGSLWLGVIALVFFLTVAMIAPATSNRAFPVRLYLTVAWLISAGVFFEICRGWGAGEGMTVWAMGWAFVLLPAVLLSTSERDVSGPRLRRAVPRARLLRIPAFLLFSGAGAGLLWAGGLFALTLVVAQLTGAWLDGDELPFGHGGGYGAWRFFGLLKLGTTGLFVLGYALLGVALRRAFLKRRPKLEVATAAVVFVVMMFAMVVPMIVTYALYPQTWDNRTKDWLFLNPLAPLVHSDGDWSKLNAYDTLLAWIALAMVGIGLLVNLTWFLRQMTDFSPPGGHRRRGGRRLDAGGGHAWMRPTAPL